jgi:MoaA/NifB/PqqE/SkfB family radical SAM enzyme
MNENIIYTINSNYMLKNDLKRIVLCYRYHPVFSSPSHYAAEREFFSYIHPEQAKIFSLFDGEKKLGQIIAEIANKLSLSEKRVEKLIFPFIENNTRLGVDYKGNKFMFPKNFIVPINKNAALYSYKACDFDCEELEFKNYRLNKFPMEVTLMVNTICAVDCIYCYADCRKKMDCQIPVQTLENLFNDCKRNNVRAFGLMGGEVLKYKNWRWIVSKMMDCGYTPYISTKIPISDKVVCDIYDSGIRLFQISLDSFDGNILEKNLNIIHGDLYIRKMRKTLSDFEKIGMNINVHAVITIHNKEVSHLKKYLHELTFYKNIKNVQLSVVGESLYKDGYDKHKLNQLDVEEISNYVNESVEKNIYPFTISVSTGYTKKGYIKDRNSKEETYKKRGLCSANVRQVFILPNGDVTICEELMFHPQFILGNVIEQDLGTIWKNNKLKTLEDKKIYMNSRCGKCKKFVSCKSSESRGVCWKEILHAYGMEKWNFPDPKCPHAPTNMRPFYVE